jgi:multisubunit Na+/H+ antiporter MnhG subunit
MSEPQRRQVRIRRSPKIGVFLLLGAVIGVLVAVVAVNVTPPDPIIAAPQAIGFLALLLAPVGAAVLGAFALLLDRGAERRSKVVEAERSTPPVPVVVEPPDEADPAPVSPASELGGDPRP